MQSGDTDALKAARAKAAEVRALMKNMTQSEKEAHKQAKADEKKEKAKARYAAQKAEKLRLKEAAEELARMKAKPVGDTPPPALPKKKEEIVESDPNKQPETVEAEPDPVANLKPEVSQAPEQESKPPSEPPSEPPIEQSPEPPAEPAFDSAEPVKEDPQPPPPPKPPKKKKKVILELDSDSDDEVVSVKMPRKAAQLPASMHRPTYNDWRPRGQAGLRETMMSWPSNWQF